MTIAPQREPIDVARADAIKLDHQRRIIADGQGIG